MSFVDRMKVRNSNAEMLVYRTCVKEGLYPMQQVMIPLTIVDFFFPDVKPRGYVVELDGVPISKTGKPLGHGKAHREEWDELKNKVLDHYKIKWSRFRYKPPLPKYKAREIVEEIKQVVNPHG